MTGAPRAAGSISHHPWGKYVTVVPRPSRIASTICVSIALAAAATGCGGSSDKPAKPAKAAGSVPGAGSAATSSAAADPAGADTSAPAPAAPPQLIYSGRSIEVGDAEAVLDSGECTGLLLVTFNDDGPQITKTPPGSFDNNPGGDDVTPPRLHWTPACAGKAVGGTGTVTGPDFDPWRAAPVTGTPSGQDCRDAADQATRDGSALEFVWYKNMVPGNAFCEHDLATGRVLLLKLTDWSMTKPVHMTWSASLWSTPPSPLAASAPGTLLYRDQRFTVGDEYAIGGSPGDTAFLTPCGYEGVQLSKPHSPWPDVNNDSNSAGKDISYTPTCLANSTHPVSIQLNGDTTAVTGSPDAADCEKAAKSNARTALDVPLTQLHVGSEFCQYRGRGYGLGPAEDIVALIKVTSVTTASPVEIGLSATVWKSSTTTSR